MSEQSKLIRRVARSIFGDEIGCTDSNCFYGYAGGMATNGGCRCVEQDPTKSAKRMKKIAYELACGIKGLSLARNHQLFSDAGNALRKVNDIENMKEENEQPTANKRRNR